LPSKFGKPVRLQANSVILTKGKIISVANWLRVRLKQATASQNSAKTNNGSHALVITWGVGWHQA